MSPQTHLGLTSLRSICENKLLNTSAYYMNVSQEYYEQRKKVKNFFFIIINV